MSNTHGNVKHGYYGTPTYASWANMLQRAGKWKGYEHVKVCGRWEVFKNFLEDMGEKPEGKTLDRKKNSRGYNKSNCRWATDEQQNRNRSNCQHYEHEGKRLTIAEWARESGVARTTLYRRLQVYKMPIAEALLF